MFQTTNQCVVCQCCQLLSNLVCNSNMKHMSSHHSHGRSCLNVLLHLCCSWTAYNLKCIGVLMCFNHKTTKNNAHSHGSWLSPKHFLIWNQLSFSLPLRFCRVSRLATGSEECGGEVLWGGFLATWIFGRVLLHPFPVKLGILRTSGFTTYLYISQYIPSDFLGYNRKKIHLWSMNCYFWQHIRDGCAWYALGSWDHLRR